MVLGGKSQPVVSSRALGGVSEEISQSTFRLQNLGHKF